MTNAETLVGLRPARCGGARRLTFDNGRFEDYQSVFVQHPSGEWDRILIARDDGSIARAIVGAINTRASGLDAAWSEAEAALPEGWWLDAVSQTRGFGGDFHPGGEFLGEWIASAQRNMRAGRWARENAQGHTPTAALRALAAKLREQAG